MPLTVLSLTLILFTATTSFSFEGVVSRVKDGDTVVIQTSNRITCRLYGIDAPETSKRGKSGQPYGKEAKDNLERLIFKKSVDIEVMNNDRYGRKVCRIHRDGMDINLQMVKDGYAWAYVEYLKRPHASEYIQAENEARGKRKGLWQDYNPTPPWEFRKRSRVKGI